MRIGSSALVLVSALACGGPPGAEEAQAKLRAGDLPGAVQSYRAWRGGADREDTSLLEALALAAIERSLGSQSVEVRVAAVSAAVRVDDAALGEAVELRLGDEDPLVQTIAAAALLRAHPDAPAVLEQALHSDRADVRALAVETLGRKVGPAARPEIVRLANDPDAGVRASVADALGAVAAEGDRAQLLAMTRDASGAVRASALRALAQLREASRGPEALAAARTGVADAYLGARLASVELLDRAWPSTRGDLTAAFTDPFVALRAAVILAKRGEPGRARAVAAAALAARDPQLVQAGLNALAELLPAAEGAPLVRGLRAAGDPGVRLAAARALVRLELADEARPILHAALGLSPELRVSAATDLARLGDREGYDALLGAILDSGGTLRVTAAEALLRAL